MMTKALILAGMMLLSGQQFQIPGRTGATAGSSSLCGNGFAHCDALTLDHTKSGTADSTNWPFLVSETDSNLATVPNGGRTQNANGYDIGYYTDATCTTKLPWQTELYTAATGLVIYWVQVPTLSHTVDTVIYRCYGNASITTDQSNATGTWDANFVGVWHLPDGSTLSGGDSTSNANNSSSINATATTGKVDGAAAFNGTSQNVTVSNSTSLAFTGAVTMEAWFYETSTANYRCIMARGIDTARAYAMFLTTGSTSSIYYNNVGALSLSSSWSLNTWNHLVLTDDGTNLKVYLNGVLAYTGTNGIGATAHAYPFAIGYEVTDTSFPMAGNIDEVRLSKTVRSSSYVTASYNNQSAPSSFYTVTAIH